MFIFEKTYDIDELVRYNLHTHTNNSLCAKPEMVLSNMIKEAEKCGLKVLAVTDHCDPGSDIDVFSNTAELRRSLSEIKNDVKVLIGSELSAYGVGKFADDDRLNACLDYRNYSHVHYHLQTWEQPQDRSPYGYSRHMLAVLESLFKAHRADCVAHPFAPMKLKFFNDDEKKQVLDSFSDNDLGDIMTMGEENECAFELHKATILIYPDFFRRLFNIGKEVGVHFNFGTDAHRLEQLSTEGMAEIIKNIIK